MGWNIVATMRRPDPTLFTAGDDLLIARLDVEDAASIEDAIEAGMARFGGIDVLINNAGFGLFGIFEGTPRDRIRQQFDVNLFGVMDVTRAVLPHFRAQGSGLIVNVSSGAGVFTLPMMSLYCASKFALEGFSEALSYELATQNIGLKVIEPGGVVSTNFGARSGSEAGQVAQISDYNGVIAATGKLFDGLRTMATATEPDVAAAIYAATTDGTDQLRYVVTDDIKPLIAARRTTSEAEYIAFMRSRFMPV